MNTSRNKSAKTKGFTVVEIAMVLLISGFMFTIFLGLYQSFKSQREYNQTLENMAVADLVMQEFYSQNGRFPCPADPTLEPIHPDYGIELPCGSGAPSLGSEECSATTRPLHTDGTASGVICTNVGTRDVDNDGTQEYALIGILPFRTLSENTTLLNIFPEYASRDGYTMRLTYTVTEVMADVARNVNDPANLSNGAIALFDENGRNVTAPQSNVYYTFISHGENMKGAYNDQGNRVESCVMSITGVDAPAGLNNPTDFGGEIDIENENCDNNDGVFRSALKSIADGESYFDDIVYYRNILGYDIWRTSPFTPQVPGEERKYYYNTNIGMVGVGTNNPTAKLHVVGDIIAAHSAGAEEGFCDNNRPRVATPTEPDIDGDAECFRPEFIFGSEDVCPAGQVAVGFSQNTLDCELLFETEPPNYPVGNNCPAGEFATGLTYNRTTGEITFTCDVP